MDQYRCRICGNTAANTAYDVREMLHGSREKFRYFQCSNCGCLQISCIPTDLARFYPADYQVYKDYSRKAHNKVRRLLESRQVLHELTGGNWIGRLLAKTYSAPDYAKWCKFMGVGLDAKILDVGCGNGKLLSRMVVGGFAHLRGIDPFIQKDIAFNQGAQIYKRDLPTHIAVSHEKYDLVMLHHSFEHMENPRQVLKWCTQLMTDDGWLLIRIPLADSDAWEQYRENWFQLDPPRHLFVHTSKSMHQLVKQCGLYIEAEERDSTGDQFIYSELYRRDIPANAPRSQRTIFSKKQIREYAERAQSLNSTGRGDQGVFYSKKVIPERGNQTGCG